VEQDTTIVHQLDGCKMQGSALDVHVDDVVYATENWTHATTSVPSKRRNHR
jgi:hypothetical protein